MSRDHGVYELLSSSKASAPAPLKGPQNLTRAGGISIPFEGLPGSLDAGPMHPTSRHRIISWKGLANRYWIYESTSCLLAVAALAGIVGVLGRFNGHPIPQWPHHISINALVAVLTVILKAALLLPVTEGISELKWSWFRTSQPLSDISAYDSASRGPWGSFKFLVTRKPQFLASMGALITFFALAIDPFSQQVIKYQSCLQPTDSNTAQIALSNNYSATGIHEGAGMTALDGPMTAAIYNGLLSPALNASSLISFQCSSGNCTFPSDAGASYSSLAMCYEVQDISQYVENVTQEANSSARYVLPSGPELYEATMLSSIVPVYYDNNATASENPPQNLSNAIFTFEALMFSCDSGSGKVCPSPFAIRASIYPCLKTYGGNITNSVLTERTISSTPLTLNSREDSTLCTNTTLRNGSISQCKAEDGAQTSMYSVPVYGPITSTSDSPSTVPNSAFITNTVPNNTVQYYAPDCTYSLNAGAVQAISQFLNSLFNNNNVSSPYALYNDVTGDLWLLNLYMNATANLSTVNTYMQGLTDAMTAVIRARGDPASSGYTNYASGTVFDNQTCISVRWGWLALPAALLLMGILFLIATIISTSSQSVNGDKGVLENRGHFKSSPLALLFHGIEPRTLQSLPQPTDVASMEVLAGRLHVSRRRDTVGGSTHFVAER